MTARIVCLVTLLAQLPLQTPGAQTTPLNQAERPCPSVTAAPLLEKFGVVTQESDCFFNTGRLSLVVESPNVLVNGTRASAYRFQLASTESGFVLTESVDGMVLDRRELSEGLDFQLLFFGEAGYFFSPTREPSDFRVVETRGFGLRVVVAMSVTGERIFLGDGSGPFRTFNKRLTLEGERTMLIDEVVKSADDIVYSHTKVQQETPAMKYARLVGRAVVGKLPTDFSNENILVRGPGTVAGLVAMAISRPDLPVGPLTVALNSIAKNLQSINALPKARDPKLRDIDVEVVAAKIFKLNLCILARAAGSLGDASGGLLDEGDFGECIDEIDDLGEAVGATPNCTRICAAPRPFSIDRCRPNAPNTFNGIQPMEDLCDVFNDLRGEILKGPNAPRAAEFVGDMEANLASLFEKIWTKLRGYCGCP